MTSLYFCLVNLSSLFILFCCPYCSVWSGSSHHYIYKVIVTDFLYLRVSSLNFFVLSFLCLTSRSGSCWNHFYSFSFLFTDYCTSVPKKILKFYYASFPNTRFQPQMHRELFKNTNQYLDLPHLGIVLNGTLGLIERWIGRFLLLFL